MAGIYIHVPFCKTRCIYCDFYSSVKSGLKDQYIDALCTELEQRKDYLYDQPIETIYLGGGTPSQLSHADYTRIFDKIDKTYSLNTCKEITLEANPDDLTNEYLDQLSALPFNRLSIGIQTFNDNILKLLKRRHTADEAVKAVERARKAGFSNISIDLMYGLPGQTLEGWSNDLQKAIKLNAEHISAYHLTYEKGTRLFKMFENNDVNAVNEEESIQFFNQLTHALTQAGYEHYEISNFSKPGLYSRHNTSYWQGIPYLGCGPSAHSYNGTSREWNVSSLTEYIQGVKSGNRRYETETLDKATCYNELIITSIRTKWGLSLARLENEFGKDYLDYLMKMSQKYIHNGDMELNNGVLKLTSKGIFISDGIMSDLLYLDN